MPAMPKNILYLSSFGHLKWGGQKSLFQLVTRLDRRQYRPYVLLPTDEDFAEALRVEGIDVIILKLPRLKGLSLSSIWSALRELSQIIRRYDIRLIHTDGPRNTIYAGLVAKIRRIPLVFHVRSSDRDPYDPLLCFLSTRIVLVAEALKNRFSCNHEKLVTIYNGVDLNEYQAQSAASSVRQACITDRDTPLITCVGRVEPMKGQAELIDACSRIEKEKTRFHLLFVGDIADGDYWQLCNNRVQQAGLSDMVTFRGHERDMVPVLSGTDIFVLPSFGEAFSRAILEAMAMGKAVITTNVGGSAEAVQDGVSGFVVPPGDPAALAEKIIVMAKDRALRERFGLAARRRVETLFTIERNVLETQRLYDEIGD
jgi:glycosyltransferase involved in cell wall biosynthesis